MEFTGERYIPSIAGHLKYEHLHRYALSLDFVAGKSVLDLASGEGYGSALLAGVAQSVVGVDLDRKTVEIASYKYSDNQKLKFLIGSCDSVPLPKQSVEVVISFETIEHHDRHEEMMLEIKRVLKADGLLIISSPNRLTYSDEPNYSNPFHVKELYYEELCDLLYRHFKYVRIYGQRLATGSFVFPIEESSHPLIKAYTGASKNINQQICSLNSPIYFIALCSDEKAKIQKPINSIYIDNLDDLFKANEKKIEQMRATLKESQNQLEKTQADKLHWQLHNTQAEYQRLQSYVHQTQTEYQRLQSYVRHTQTEYECSQSYVQQTQTEYERLQSYAQHLDTQLQRSQVQLQQTHSELEQTKSLLNSSKMKLEQCQFTMIAMKNSKFWQLRVQWLNLKKFFGLG